MNKEVVVHLIGRKAKIAVSMVIFSWSIDET